MSKYTTLALALSILIICCYIHCKNPEIYKTNAGFILGIGIVIGLILFIISEFSILTTTFN